MEDAIPKFLEEFKSAFDKDHFDNLDRLVKYYESIGFMNINDLVGYENAIAMAYSCDDIKKVMEDFRSGK